METDTKNLMRNALQSQKSLFQIPKIGDIMEGKILGKESGVLYIDLGIYGTAVVYGVEYFKVHKEIKNMKAGSTIVGKLIELENKKGFMELSLKKAEEEKNWKYLQDKFKNREQIKVKIVDANKGGLMAEIGDLKGFLPVSQLAPSNYPRVEGGDKNKILNELRLFIGKSMEVRILDLDFNDNKLILSEKSAESNTIQNALKKYKIGDVVKGEITGVVEFGAFIKFDPMLEGLIHISELDWSLIENPNDIVKLGKKVKAKIIDISNDGKISLSLKALKNNPWESVDKKYKKGDNINKEVVKINAYGALIKIEEGIQGLVHISEFDSEKTLKEKLTISEKYNFEIISIDAEGRKISLKLSS